MSQAMDALAEANRRRFAKAGLKREIRVNPEALLDALDDPPGFLENAELGELVRALPRFGPDRTYRLVNRCGMSVHKRFGSLTARQRVVLASAVRQVFAPQEVAA